MHRGLGITVSIVAAAACAPAVAAPVQFFGQDQTVAYTVPANSASEQARKDWAAKLSAGTMLTEDFQSNVGLGVPLSGLFGGTNSTITGSGEVKDQQIDLGVRTGRFSTSSTCSADLGGGGCGWFETSASFTLTFEKAISAFGFFGTDIGDFDGTLSITLLSGGKELDTLDVTASTAASTADVTSLLFFGFADSSLSIDQIRFNVTQKSGSPTIDYLGFDDFMAGAAAEPPVDVPEPGSLALAGLALAGLGAMRRKRG